MLNRLRHENRWRWALVTSVILASACGEPPDENEDQASHMPGMVASTTPATTGSTSEGMTPQTDQLAFEELDEKTSGGETETIRVENSTVQPRVNEPESDRPITPHLDAVPDESNEIEDDPEALENPEDTQPSAADDDHQNLSMGGHHQSEEGELDEAEDMAPAAPDDVCVAWGSDCEDLEYARGRDRTRYPIVLVHGFMGWARVLWIDYFYRVPENLRAAGYTVFVPTTDPINSSEVRSRQLARQVDRFLACTCADKLNFIAHSQGGIDVRHLMGPLRYHDRVASLTTIATPHEGFQLADEALRRSPTGVEFLGLLGGLLTGVAIGQPDDDADLRKTLTALSKATMTEFNRTWPDPPQVALYSFAGFSGVLSDGGPDCQRGERPSPRRGDIVEPALLATYALSGGFRTPNDGLIPVKDCIRGRWMGCVAADHWDQVGQAVGLTDAFDHDAFYLDHAEFLVREGH
ncbi:MAG: triacylglycerol lipase [Myxococcota bacterium]|nr:triacylglycerol lipase [Myxococcota bacterium]